MWILIRISILILSIILTFIWSRIVPGWMLNGNVFRFGFIDNIYVDLIVSAIISFLVFSLFLTIIVSFKRDRIIPLLKIILKYPNWNQSFLPWHDGLSFFHIIAWLLIIDGLVLVVNAVCISTGIFTGIEILLHGLSLLGAIYFSIWGRIKGIRYIFTMI